MKQQAGIIDFAVFENGKEFLGMANITLPDVTNKVFTVNGAGIAGDYEVPVLGQTDAMSCTFTFTDNPKDAYKLARPGVHNLECRAVHEEFDTVANKLRTRAYKHILKVIPKNQAGGTVAPASQQGASVECSVLYREDWIDDKRVLLIDKANNRFIGVDGVDINEQVNSALGRI